MNGCYAKRSSPTSCEPSMTVPADKQKHARQFTADRLLTYTGRTRTHFSRSASGGL